MIKFNNQDKQKDIFNKLKDKFYFLAMLLDKKPITITCNTY